MELRMNYNAFIKLKDFINVTDVNCEICEYRLKNDMIEGTLNVNGKYLRGDLERSNSFSEDIPFNIILGDQDYVIEDIDCINLDYHVIDGRGFEIEFDILVIYTDLEIVEESNFTDVEYEFLEDENQFDEHLTTNNTNEDQNNYPSDYNEEIIDEERKAKKDDLNEEITPINEDNSEVMKDEITEEIERKLLSTLSVRDDNLPTEEEVSEPPKSGPIINMTGSDRSIRNTNITSGIKEKKEKIKICYFKDDKDLEEVCKKHDVGIDQVFRENRNNDFNKHRRIIIK